MIRKALLTSQGRRAAAAVVFALALNPVFAAANAASTAGKTPSADFDLSIENQRLSFQGRGIKLRVVLERLARKADVVVHLPGALAEQDITDAFSDLPMNRALSRLLLGTSHVVTFDTPTEESEHFIYTATARVNYRGGPGLEHERLGRLESGERVLVIGQAGPWLQVRIPSSTSDENFVHSDFLQLSEGSVRAQRKSPQQRRVKEIRVLRTGTLLAGAGSENVTIAAPPSTPSPRADNNTDEKPTRFYTDPDVQPHLDALFAQLEGAPTEKKLEVIIAAGSIGPDDKRVHELLLQSLEDPDARVRQGALRSFVGAGNAPPIGPLREIALRDSSVDLRLEALRVLSENFPPATSGEILQEASRDRDARISSHAKKLLEMLGS